MANVVAEEFYKFCKRYDCDPQILLKTIEGVSFVFMIMLLHIILNDIFKVL